MPETTTAPFKYTSLYIDANGTYFDVLDALPDAPPGSVIVNVSGLVFGLEAHDLGLLLGMLGPNANHRQLTLTVDDPDGQAWVTATSDEHGLELRVGFPACGANAAVVLPHDQADRVRAAIKEVTESE
ncbi:hypothetical protein FAF44_02950 [Nonomuraea sp. MG754425]|uniref:hypothetical protein n=1 Tax=Nonomuraea sp. MG754425 TaxID=2570319 RepID=UPI001F4842D1|nr:hypothetical protein [Nonomuraea sp. MG754425]MCF6467373.1 hypothetical protein [Nonomuraea sp. MG754425]